MSDLLEHLMMCPYCNGSGKRKKEDSLPGMDEKYNTCPCCIGQGNIPKNIDKDWWKGKQL